MGRDLRMAALPIEDIAVTETACFLAALLVRSLFAAPRYLIRVGDSISQFANVLLLDGDPNESISGRSYRQGWRKAVRVIDFFLGEGHCSGAYFADVQRAGSTLRSHASLGARK